MKKPKYSTLANRGLKTKTTNAGTRYGRLFQGVRKQRCWLWTAKYYGPGHQICGPGVQGGHTAHHTGRYDEEGLLPGCGCAHDLYAGLGGRETLKTFRAWLDREGYNLKQMAMSYVKSFG